MNAPIGAPKRDIIITQSSSFLLESINQPMLNAIDMKTIDEIKPLKMSMIPSMPFFLKHFLQWLPFILWHFGILIYPID
jgi:hypothetical protein